MSSIQTKPISVPEQILIWIVLYAFWVVFSIDYHPTFLIDVIVTALLLIAYASAVYVNHLVLIPRLLRTRNYFGYCSGLIASMSVLTFIVLFAIRATYFSLADPNRIGDYWWHYSIDLFGMIVHVSAAALLIWIVTRVRLRNRSNATNAV